MSAPKITEADAQLIARKLMDLFEPILNGRLNQMQDTIRPMVLHEISGMTAVEVRHLIREKVKDVQISAEVTVKA